MEPKKWKNKNFGVALGHSLNGIKAAFQSERNLKIQVVCAILAIIMGIFFKLTQVEWLVLCVTIAMVFFTELMNTAMERILDVYSQKYDETIKQAKDIASGAVLLTAIFAVIIGCILFLPKMGNIK